MESEAARRRRKKLLHLRATFGGVSAFGYPYGPIPGVQTPPNDPPPCNPDQFGSGGSAPADAGGSGDSGGAGGGTP